MEKGGKAKEIDACHFRQAGVDGNLPPTTLFRRVRYSSLAHHCTECAVPTRDSFITSARPVSDCSEALSQHTSFSARGTVPVANHQPTWLARKSTSPLFCHHFHYGTFISSFSLSTLASVVSPPLRPLKVPQVPEVPAPFVCLAVNLDTSLFFRRLATLLPPCITAEPECLVCWRKNFSRLFPSSFLHFLLFDRSSTTQAAASIPARLPLCSSL